HPASPNARDSLGEALEAGGRFQEAAAAYRQALELGRGRQDPNLALYRSHLNRVQQKTGPREPSPGPAR
ncbi:tetratricopeptide repeat-containing protein, partial [Candidatus Parcubacteria bacterium]